MSAYHGKNAGPFSGSVLKVVAVITMLIDHVAYGLLYRMFYFGMYPSGWDAARADSFYRILRYIGRSAFPIYCFLLVEGFFHTRSRFRYALRLLLFSILSEVFFDLTLTIWVDPESFAPVTVLKQNPATAAAHQNVFFTLLVGLITIWLMETVRRLLYASGSKRDNLRILRITITSVLTVFILFGGLYIADYLDTDYRYWGVLMIVLFYLLSFNRKLQAVVPYVLLCVIPYLFVHVLPGALLHALPEAWQGYITPWSTEVYAFPAFLLILFYNGKRGFLKGTPAKIAFYAFYPVHLCIIYLVRLMVL